MTPNLLAPIANSQNEDKASDDFLRAMVDACISNVAVLDESGAILYASNAWCLFQQGTPPEPERYEIAPYYFDSCKRLSGSEFEKDGDVTLEDDLQQILFGEEREFHHEYCCKSINKGRAVCDACCTFKPAEVDLPGFDDARGYSSCSRESQT